MLSGNLASIGVGGIVSVLWSILVSLSTCSKRLLADGVRLVWPPLPPIDVLPASNRYLFL